MYFILPRNGLFLFVLLFYFSLFVRTVFFFSQQLWSFKRLMLKIFLRRNDRIEYIYMYWLVAAIKYWFRLFFSFIFPAFRCISSSRRRRLRHVLRMDFCILNPDKVIKMAKAAKSNVANVWENKVKNKWQNTWHDACRRRRHVLKIIKNGIPVEWRGTRHAWK